MNITVKDSVGFDVQDTLKIIGSFTAKLPDGKSDYKLQTFGIFEIMTNIKLPYPIVVKQENKRKSDKSPIVISIKKHIQLF